MSDERGRDDADPLPVFDAIEDVEPGPRPPGGPAARRDLRLGPARGAGIAAAALILLVAGIAVGSIPRDGEPVRSRDGSVESGTDLTVHPTSLPGLCRPTSGPEFVILTLAPVGVPYLVDALPGAAYPVGEEPPDGISWLVPPTSAALFQPTPQRLVLGADREACLRRLVITYAATVDVPDNVSAQLLFEGRFDGAVPQIELDAPPAGDWVMWVEAEYAAVEPSAPNLVTVSFFRVIVGVAPVVTDEPAVTDEPPPVPTPLTPCSQVPASEAIVVTMSGSATTPVPGIANFVPSPAPEVPPEIPYVAVGPGDPVRIDIAGAACAVSWEIRLMDPYGGQSGDVYHVSNPNDDPSRAAQNHWEIPIQAEQYVIATLHFPAGPTIVRTWHVVPSSFPLPAAFLVARDGSRFTASAGCGLTLRLANGFASDAECDVTGYDPTEDALHVGSFEPLTFEIPGWGLQSWNATCGMVPSDGSQTYTNDGGCRLGGATSDDGGVLPVPAAFVLGPGDTIVRIYASAMAPNGDQFAAPFFARVIAR